MCNSNLLIFLIIIFSCNEPIIQKDCAGISGGTAIIDDCGFCVGGNTGLLYNYIMGCDSICGSGSQIDCNGICGGTNILDCSDYCYNPLNNELPLKVEDYCGECYSIEDTLSFNSTCSGCRDVSACNYDSLAMVHDGSCIFPTTYCTDNDSDGLVELTINNPNYYCPGENPDSLYFCGPGTNCCSIDTTSYIDSYYSENCIGDTISTEVLDCLQENFNQDTMLTYSCWPSEFIGNDNCFLSLDEEVEEGIVINISFDCSELNYDGGDCSCQSKAIQSGFDLYEDCIGRCFGNDWCEDPDLGYDGCVEGESTWLGDGSCDNDQEEGGLDLNCILWDFDNGDCSTNQIYNQNKKKLNKKNSFK